MLSDQEFESQAFRKMEEISPLMTFDDCQSLLLELGRKYRRRYGLLDEILENPELKEIMINGTKDIFVEDGRGIHRIDLHFSSQGDLEEIIRSIAGSVHREINEMNPILDARLPDGSRVNAVYHNIVLDGPVLTIRKFSQEHMDLANLIEHGSLDEGCAAFLQNLVRSGYNLFLCGGTSSGKTTFLNALCDYIPRSERVIIIEDSRELMLPQIENLVQMECHNANAMGKGMVRMDQLIRTSLRMRPDRIIVGEVRGGEVADMLQAMNTGHCGISTGHGNSVPGMLRRMEAMYLMHAQIPMDSIRAQIVEGLDVLIHLKRMEDGRRQVMAVTELLGYAEGEYILNPLYERNCAGELEASGNEIIHRK